MRQAEQVFRGAPVRALPGGGQRFGPFGSGIVPAADPDKRNQFGGFVDIEVADQFAQFLLGHVFGFFLGKTVVVVRFKGVNDRNAAEALNGTALYIDRSQLPDDELDEDEFYQTDLIGLVALDAEGKRYGTVSAVFDFGGGDLIELSEKGKRPMLIPFTEAAVPEIDFDKGTILVEPYAAGLIADEEDGKPQQGGKRPKKP